MGILGAIRRKFGSYPPIWKAASSKLAIVDVDPAGFIEGFVYSGSEEGRGGTAWIRRWERGRGVAWQREGKATHYLLPVLGGSVVYETGKRGSKRQLVATDGRTGEERWRQPLGAMTEGEPWVANGSLTLIGTQGEWQTRDPATGASLASGTFRSTAERDAFLDGSRPAVDYRYRSNKTRHFDQAALVESWSSQGADSWAGLRSVCEARYPGWEPRGSEFVPLTADPIAKTVTVLVHSKESYDRNHSIVATIDPIGKEELRKVDLGMTTNHSPRPTHPYVQWFGETVTLEMSDVETVSASGESVTGQVVSFVHLPRARLSGQISGIAESWIALPDGGRHKFRA